MILISHGPARECDAFYRLYEELSEEKRKMCECIMIDIHRYWMGHSQKVAKKHCLHVLTDQYNLALNFDQQNTTDAKKTDDDKQENKPDEKNKNPPETQQSDSLDNTNN